jgi:SAM-dependent methyltransferase
MFLLDYSKYYELLYKDKNYSEESTHINNIIKNNTSINKNQKKKILELGCGTGLHAISLLKYGYEIDGYDLSDSMIEIANTNKFNSPYSKQINFYHSDIRDYKSNKKYDVVMSLFHVISYQVSNDDIHKVFKKIKLSLKDGGIFIFDIWYGPAVLHSLPEKRVKIVEDSDLKITRNAIPIMDYRNNVVHVDYDIKVEAGSEDYLFHERHSMRYFFEPEINMFAQLFSMSVIHVYESYTYQKPSEKTWGAMFVIKNSL